MRMPKSLIGVKLQAILSGILSSMDSDVPEIHAIWDEAKTHIEHGDHSKAIDIYKYILVRYSDNDIAVQYANAYLGDVYITLRPSTTDWRDYNLRIPSLEVLKVQFADEVLERRELLPLLFIDLACVCWLAGVLLKGQACLGQDCLLGVDRHFGTNCERKSIAGARIDLSLLAVHYQHEFGVERVLLQVAHYNMV